MNYLAHALLAQPGTDWIVGGFLGDHLTGAGWRELPPVLGAGVQLHRRIDAFTDSHAAFIAARNRYQAPFRRVAPIALDIYFDHLLASKWADYSDRSLNEFVDECYGALEARWDWLPDSLRRYYLGSSPRRILARYADPAVVRDVLAAVGGRFKRANVLAQFWPHLEAHRDALSENFRVLFADLQVYASDEKIALIKGLEHD